MHTMTVEFDEERRILAVSEKDEKDGLIHILPKAAVLAMGGRERTRDAIGLPGFRPSSIFRSNRS